VRRFSLVLLCWLLAAGPGAPQENHARRRARAFRVEQPPTLDGLVNEPLWEKIVPAGDFVQQEPDEGAVATEKTEVRVGFDDNNLYIGIICYDSQPQNIVVTQNRRDAPLENTDSVVILLETFNDDQNAFLFGTSPTGIEYDGQVSKAGQGRGEVRTPSTRGAVSSAGGDGGTRNPAQRGGASAFNLNWDGVWKVRSQITARGWESEMAIPFKTLRYAVGPETIWGLNVSRNLRRKNEQSYWAPVKRPFNLNQVELAGDLEGLELKTHRNLKVIPYVLGGLQQDYSRARDRTKFARDAGVDLKYSLTPSLTLDATFNTDFAQVEVDEEQVNLTRFDLFFPEKRGFFLENAGTFEFGTPREVELFFSRRIGIDDSGEQVPIDAGLRLSGKVGRFDLGLLNMQTRELEGFSAANNFTVFRLSRELANRSSVGFIGVNRQSTTRFEGRPAFNRAFGADLNLGLGRYANLFSYAAKSQSPGLRGSDHAYASVFEYDNQHHRPTLIYMEVGRNFNPEVGFLRRSGYRRGQFGYGYTHYPQSRRIRTVYPHFHQSRWYTLGTNDKESGFDHYDVFTRWQSGATLGVGFNRFFERIDKPFEVFPGVSIRQGRFHFHETFVSANTDPTATFFASTRLAVGTFYGGTIRTLTFGGGYRRGRNITLTPSWTRNIIDVPEGAFHTDLVTLRFNWSFTPKSYVQSLTQYNNTTNQVGANIRLAFLTTSSTGLFVVYNTRLATTDFLDPHEIQRRTQSRALFFKFNYLFDF